MKTQPLRAFADISKTASDFSSLGELCAYARFNGDAPVDDADARTEVLHMENAAILLLVHGSLKVQHNTKAFAVNSPALIAFGPGSTVIVESDDWRAVDLHIIYITTAMMPDINVSFSSIAVEALMQYSTPCASLDERETSLMLRYFKLLHNVMLDDYHPGLCRHTVGNLITALIYQMTMICLREIRFDKNLNASGNRNAYVSEFIKMVHINFMKERSINYYARRLCISPKYLSMLVKDATGQTASRWIDHFIITEAKNMLRYSGKNIQQVAYALNFSNQSSFGKYFKHVTGMSPTEFQKQR